MLLTLVTRTLKGLDLPTENGAPSLFDLPPYVMSHLRLRGMNVPASQLAGWTLQDLDKLRDCADKAGCPCLVLVEDKPLAFGATNSAKVEAALDRVRVLAVAAHRLGCNAVSISCAGKNDDATFDRAAEAIKSVMPEVERLELNVLIAPSDGLTHDPERLTDLIKRIGGFRIGSLPSFGHAAATGDIVGTLRKLAPYAGAVHATIKSFSKAGKHSEYDLAECVEAIRSVGFVNTLAIDCESVSDLDKTIELARGELTDAIENPPQT